MFKLVAGILGSALSIWDSKEANKYKDEYRDILQEYYGELEKPTWEQRHDFPEFKNKEENFRDNAIMDRAERRLYILGEAVSAAVGKGKSI